MSQLQQAVTGDRAQAFVAAHVPGEMPSAIARVAASRGGKVEARAFEVWNEVLAPLVRVVDLPIREHLDPQVHDVIRNAYAKGGDPDDLSTAALARLLAPSLLVSEDSVFSRVGMGVPLSAPIGVQAAARAARGELAFIGGVHASVVAGRLAHAAARAGVVAVGTHPVAALMLLLAVSTTGWIIEGRAPGPGRALASRASRMRKALPGLAGLAFQSLMDAREVHLDACSSVVTVRRRDHQTMEEAAAVVLSRVSGTLSIAAVHEEISRPRLWSSVAKPHDVVRGKLIAALRRHDASVESKHGWSLGRPARSWRPADGPNN